MGLGVSGGELSIFARSPAVCSAVGPRMQSQGLVSLQPGSCLENPRTRLLLSPRVHMKAWKEKLTLPCKALEMGNFGEGGKAASSGGQVLPSSGAVCPWLCGRGTGVMASHPSCCTQPEPGRYTTFLSIMSGCIQQLCWHQWNNSSFRRWGLTH